jgi:hypothetical protein
MVKVAQMELPPGYEDLLNKILAWFNNQIYPTWATRYFHTTRKAKKENKEKTFIPGAREIWNSFDLDTKLDWFLARGYTTWSGYNLFLADYSYRRKNGLSLPGTANTSHQLYGLKMSNPGAGNEVVFRLHLKDLVGPLTIDWYYKKTEYQATFGDPFNLIAEALFFDGGLNIVDEETWEAPSGNVDWSHVTLTIGESGRRYFHLIIQFSIMDYDCDIFFDNFKVSDQNGSFFTDSFTHKAAAQWAYEAFYRKQGWAFYPEFAVPFFEVLYLDN